MISEIAMSLGMACMFVRSAISVMALTYASNGKVGVLLLLWCSLLYFGFVTVLEKWELIQKNASVVWLYWIKVVPASLSLGVIAIIIMVLLGNSRIAHRAYALQMLIVVCALSSVTSFSIKVFQLFRAAFGGGAIERQQLLQMGSNRAGIALGSMDGWKSMKPGAQLLFVASYILDSVLWTWLVIHYRYYSHSLLVESPWIMASLWIFLSSCWLHSVGAFLVAYRAPGAPPLTPPK